MRMTSKNIPFFETILPENLSLADAARVKDILRNIQGHVSHDLDWAAYFNQAEWPKNTALICDNQTWMALGKKIIKLLEQSGYKITLLNLGSTPEASDAFVDYLVQHTKDCEGLIAVGSGTLNDLAKYSAHLQQKPYAICGTAPSMNGYLSANVAITLKGHKKSLSATLPRLALFDLDVMKAAPQRLRNAGLGDSLCRSTAQIDWLLSHHLLGTAYDSLPFALLKPYEAKLLAGDSYALIMTLLLSGLGMTLAKGSYPASQGEHLLAHYAEMRFPEIAHDHLHGEQIAVTTLYMARLQEQFLRMPSPPQWTKSLPDQTFILDYFGVETGEEIWKEWDAKLTLIGNQKAFNERLASKWNDIKTLLTQYIVPEIILRKALEQSDTEELGLNATQWQEALRHAPLIRNRFTFLDLGLMSGIYAGSIDR